MAFLVFVPVSLKHKILLVICMYFFMLYVSCNFNTFAWLISGKICNYVDMILYCYGKTLIIYLI